MAATIITLSALLESLLFCALSVALLKNDNENGDKADAADGDPDDTAEI